MASKLYFSVVRSWTGEWAVCSFGGRTGREERLYAKGGYQRCILVTTDHDKAQQCAADARRLDAADATAR